MAKMITQKGYLAVLSQGGLEALLDHGSIQGLADDDHTQYILVTDLEADRATVNAYWEDLTDGGATALHSHAGGSGDLKADGTIPMTADWDLGEFTIQVDTVSATAGTGLRLSDDSDTLGIFIKDGGDVGVGLVTPERKFHIVGTEGQVGTFPASLGAKDYLVVENNDNCNIGIVLGANKAGGLKFYEDGEAAHVGGLTYDCPTETLRFIAGGTTPMTLTGAGLLFINETANANMTVGFTINQGASDDEAIALKSSDVAHGRTGLTEADTYGVIKKFQGDGGGLLLMGFKDADASAFGALLLAARLEENPDTTKTTAGRGLVEIHAYQSSGDSDVATVNDGNIFVIRTKPNLSGADSSVFILGEDGDTWQLGVATMTSLKLGATALSETDLIDLTDGGATALHSHAAGGGDIKADGTVPMTADWPFGNFSLFIGDDANANMTIGLTINQGGNDNEIIALKSSDVAHGMTTQTETDTFARIKKVSNASGGLRITGYSATGTDIGLIIRGATTDETTGKTSGDHGAVLISGGLKTGTTFGSMSANANILAVANNSATVFIVDASGETWQSGSMWINETINAKMTIGLTINQGAADDEILAFKSSDIGHDFAAYTEIDTFCTFAKYSGDLGGVQITGYAETYTGLRLHSRVMTEDASPDFGTIPTILMSCQLTDGAGGLQAQSNDACLMAVRNHSLNKWMVVGDGRTFQPGGIFINEFTNANMTIGLTINQGGADDEIMAFKSSDISHGAYGTEADTWGKFYKRSANEGGMTVAGYKDANTDARGGLILQSHIDGDVPTTKEEAGYGASIELWGVKTAAGAIANQTVDGNIVSMNTYVNDGWRCRWHLDEDGDTWQFGDLTLGSGEGQRTLYMNATGNDTYNILKSAATPTSSQDELFRITAYWAANEVAYMQMIAGADTTNKDEGQFEFWVANGGAPALALWIGNNKNLLSYGGIQAGRLVSTATAWIEIGASRTDSGIALLDLIGDTTYTDYGLRIIRSGTGLNTTSQIIHRGTGTFSIITDEAADIEIQTDSALAVKISSDGEVTEPLQPAFQVWLSAQQDIDTLATEHDIEFDTEIFDIGSNFNTGTYTFTAPVTGKYSLTLLIRAGDVDTAAQYIQWKIITSNREYTGLIDPNYSGDLNFYPVCLAITADMDANDTAKCIVRQNLGAAQLFLQQTALTAFSGHLAC